MDLHRLTLRAIGPYATEYSIDFAALGASGVFLLEGPTGSGKSTIIDAIVFALYGGLAGSASSDDRLHSHHAAPSVEPFVELVFETAAGIHRIRRTPAWERPKKSGTGTTRVNQAVTLLRLPTPDATVGEPVSSRAQEVGAEIRTIIGLTKEQFLQTIVLPQGEFARFLGASGEDRRLVLQSLFGTEIYDRTTDELVALRRAAHGSVAAAETAVAEALAGLRGAAGDDELEAEGARAAVSGFSTAAALATTSRDEARSVRDAAEAARAAAAALVEALARRSALLDREAAVTAASDSVDGQRSRLERARRAATVLAPQAAVEKADEAAERARIALTKAEADHPDLGALPLVELDEARDRLVADVERLHALAAVEAALVTRRSEFATAKVALDEARTRLSDGEVAASARSAPRIALAAEVEASAVGAAQVESARGALREAGAALDAVRHLAVVRAASDRAAEQLLSAARSAHEAVEVERLLRTRRITGMAGELALALVDGEPCAVCGAVSHPAPAPLVDDHPSAEDIEAAEVRRAAAEATLAAARDEVSRLAARVADAASAAGAVFAPAGGADAAGAGNGVAPGAGADAGAGVAPADAAADAGAGAGAATLEEAAAQRFEAARARVATAEEFREAHVGLVAALDAYDSETARVGVILQESRLAVATESARLEGLRARIDEGDAQISLTLDQRQGAATVAELLTGARERQLAVTTVAEARSAFERAAEEKVVRSTELAASLHSSGFESAEQAAASALEPAAMRAIEASIGQHDREVAVVAAGLASPEIAELSGDESPDPESATARAVAAEGSFALASDEAAVAVDRAARSERALRAFDAALAQQQAVAVETRAVVRMADVAAAAGPENRTGVTLGTYVLLRRFDDVVAAANGRLQTMSSGRYLLEASERETSSRARKTGLALAIRDNATDTTRDPKSFSGGETFYASLSLALGLADVVQAEAGGIDLGTLFVDEGFGTLDPETLDAVMSELGRLSASGRVVGIVSHVEDLKQRISDRIEVRRRPDGSSVLTSTAGV